MNRTKRSVAELRSEKCGRNEVRDGQGQADVFVDPFKD